MNMMKLILIFVILCYSNVLPVNGQESMKTDEFDKKLTEAYVLAWNNPDSALILSSQLIKTARSIDYPYGYVHAMILKADAYISKGDYARAIYELLEARSIAVEKEITSIYQRINRPFGRIYIDLGSFDRAIEHHKTSLARSEEEEEKVISTLGLTEAYFAAGYLDSALIYGEPLLQQVGSLWAAPVVVMGNIYYAQGKYEKALKVFRIQSGLTYLLDEVGICVGKARTFYATDQIDSARYYGSRALELAQEKKFYKYIDEASSILASTYAGENKNINDYLKYLKINYSARDTLYGRDRLNEVNNFIFADEIRSRDLEAAALKFSTQRNVLILVSVLVIFLVAGLFLWRNNRIKSKSNRLLKEEKRKVEEALEKVKLTQSQLLKAEKHALELEQQEVDRLKELDQLKTRFFTNITHEFRTPLTVIMGMNDNIEGFEEERKLIKRNALSLLQLINQLLDLSKLDSGQIHLNVVQGNIVNHLNYLTESFYSLASDKKVELIFRTSTPSIVMDFDEQKIQHIMNNLLSNAIKFTRQGGKVFINIKEDILKGEPCLSIEVKDTGIGIHENDINKIFDRFYQADDGSQSMSVSGTGIGLALTKELINLMQGSITVKSKRDWGTSFTVLLPAYQNHNTPKLTNEFSIKPLGNGVDQNIAHLPVKPDQVNGAKPLVLVIEDSVGVVSYIRSILQDSYTIQVAMNGQEGIDLALEHIPDMIITDVMMPEKNGFMVCDFLKKDERTSHIPIIMLTAKADIQSKIEGLEMGADVYLSKPFEKKELLVRLKKLFELRLKLQKYYSDSGIDQFNKNNDDQFQEKENEFLKKVKSVVNDHMEDHQLSVSALASKLQMSHVQLYRKVKALTGMTGNQFIRKIRLDESLELLKKGEMNISEIAYSTGFSDPNYFTRIFKKQYGKSPSEWKS
jgi:signal transduction histidine kinase/DNA-binding response OmpR family regulator